MNIFIAASGFNTPGVNKVTGRAWHDADEFQREARLFSDLNCPMATMHTIDTRQPFQARLGDLEDALQDLGTLPKASPRYDAIALFCHGWQSGIQLGVSKRSLPMFVSVAKRVLRPKATIVLYACSTGGDDDGVDDERVSGPGGEGGFADALRDQLCEAGIDCTVFAHTTKGHCTKNPWVRKFGSLALGGSDDNLVGGQWVIDPRSKLWQKWLKFLQGPGRFMYPFMTQSELEATLK